MVNRLIFGFDSIEAFQDTIQLLIDLRRPKLSKDFAPSVIYKILEDSLPPISDRSLSTISRSLEDLDEAKVRLDSARLDLERLLQVETRYNRYNESVSIRLASKYLEFDGMAKLSQTKEMDYRNILSQSETELAQAQMNLEQLKQELLTLNEEVSRLMHTEVYTLQETKDGLIQNQSRFMIRKESVESRLNRKQEHSNDQKERLRNTENDIYRKEKEVKNALLELENIASDLFFNQDHKDFTGEASYDFLNWRNRLNHLRDELNKVQGALLRIEEINLGILDAEEKIADMNELIDQCDIQLKHKEAEFTTMIGLIETDLFTWKQNLVFEISDAVWQETFARLQSLSDSEDFFGKITEPIRGSYNLFVQQKEGDSARNDVALDILHAEQKELQTELKSWHNFRLPVPTRSREAEQERMELKAAGIEFRSFYELIEFRDTTDEATRSNIESAMMTTGLLDGIIAHKSLDLKHNAQMIPQEVLMSETLETYLKPTQNNTLISIDLVRVLLSSIVVGYSEHETVSIAPDGTYHLGILKGASKAVKKACFIGKEAQENFRLQRIAELELALAASDDKIKHHETLEMNLRSLITAGALSLEQMPNDEELFTIQSEMNEHHRTRSHHHLNKTFYDNRKLDLVKQRATSRSEVKLFEERFETQMNLESMSLEMDGLKDYEGILLGLEATYRDVAGYHKTASSLQEDIQLSYIDLDELTLELNDITHELQQYAASIQSIEEQLKLQGAKQISDKISANRKRITIINQDVNTYQSLTLVNLHSHIEVTKQNLTQACADAVFFKQLAGAWLDSFEKNYHHYQRSSEPGEILDRVSDYAKKLKANTSELETRRANDLKSYIRENQYELSDYGPEVMTEDAPHYLQWMNEVDVGYDAYLEVWARDQQREVLSCLDESNKRTTIFALTDSLEQYVSEQEVYISEEDRKLFEDILYNSVGQDLRRLIENAERWAMKMNAILSAQDNYRGLKLYIEWRPNRSQQEDEMHTSELVELLRKPAEMMNEADLTKMTGHFRARVDQAKILMEKDESMQNLHDVMKFVLDYRNWFSFRINYEKDLGSKRELTNNHFNKFSGGEKAIAMYLPLFTAIYARYDDANFESPRIIALDEAFAGIDDANIAELFKAMDDFGFDYILNSQALWGDYETVNHLNIYQLIRERGSQMVVNVPFYWNGTHRREIHHE